MASPPNTLQMSIRPDFAKYMVDQKALPVAPFPTGQRTDPRTQCLLSPALQATLASPEQQEASVLQARLALPSPSLTTSRPVSILHLTVRGSPVPFSLLFSPALRKFLPPGPSPGPVTAGFASTAQDQFLFLQFQNTRVQIRALLLSKEGDLSRMFRETSFFSFPRPLPQAWVEGRGLRLLPTFSLAPTPRAAQELATLLTVTVRDPAVPQRLVTKADYLCLSLQGSQPCSLFLHLSSLALLQGMVARPLLAAREVQGPGTSILLDLAGERPVSVTDVGAVGELALLILRQEPFLLPAALRASLPPGQLSLAVQGPLAAPRAAIQQGQAPVAIPRPPLLALAPRGAA